MYDLYELKRDAHSRRAFLARMSAAGLGAAAIAVLDGCDGSKKTGPVVIAPTNNPVVDATNFPGITGRNINDVVLNYASTLEVLEADLYRQALNVASGRYKPGTAGSINNTALDTTAPSGNSLGNYALSVPLGSIDPKFAKAAFLYLVQFAYVEAAHRDLLKTVLTTANYAPIVPASGRYKFATADGNPGTDLATILQNILPLEETGVRAYLGAGGFVTDNTILQAAVEIYSTECRHSASLEYILGQDPGPRNGITGVPAGEMEVQPATAPNIFEKYLAPKTVLTAASTAYFA